MGSQVIAGTTVEEQVLNFCLNNQAEADAVMDDYIGTFKTPQSFVAHMKREYGITPTLVGGEIEHSNSDYFVITADDKGTVHVFWHL